ncbi:MAG: EAL domain-containing protein [Rhodocyclaceae bacterium]|nr:EAL domain-containing protein [Rhodocyclaceae bacterium]
MYGNQAEDMDEILKRADLAMYQAKTAGRNAIRFLTRKCALIILAQIALEADIRDGLNKDQFLLYYQAQIGTDGRIGGAEALIRWQHPIRGLILPAEFVSLAGDSGLILPLGNVIMKSPAGSWPLGHPSYPCATSVSLLMLVRASSSRSISLVKCSVLLSRRVQILRIKLELTEGLFVSNVDEIIAKMSALRRIGVIFA